MVCGLCYAAIDLAIRWPDPRSFSVDHGLALANGGDPYDDRNLQPAHLICNTSKGARTNWSAIDMSNWITDEEP